MRVWFGAGAWSGWLLAMCPDLRRPPCGCVCALQDILFYQLPEHPQFYSELLNLLEEDDSGETATGTAGRQWGRVAVVPEVWQRRALGSTIGEEGRGGGGGR